MRAPYFVATGSMFDNPYGVPVEEVKRMIRESTPEIAAQVVFGKFVESSGLVFTAELINQLFDRSIPKVMGDFWIDKAATDQARIEQANSYDPYRFAAGVDLARKKDYTVIVVIDTNPRPARVVYFKRMNRLPWETIYAEIGRAQWLYGAELLCDATGSGGDVVMEELESRLYCPQHHRAFAANQRCPVYQRGKGTCDKGWHRIDPQGYTFTAGSKVQLINHLQSVLGRDYDAADPEREFGALRCPTIQHLQDELTEYAWEDRKLQTDCVFALALAAWQGIEGEVEAVTYGSVHGN